MKSFSIIFFLILFSLPLFSQTKIYTTSGNLIECQSVQKKRFGFEYIPINSTDNYKEYLANTKIDRIEYENGDVDYVSGTANKQTKRKDPKDFTFLSPDYVSLNIGPSIPYSIFSGIPTSYNMVGVNTDIDASFYPFRGLGSGSMFGGVGLGLLLGYSYNPFNGIQQQAIATSQLYADTSANITNLNVRVGGWNNFYFLGGLGYNNELGRIMIDYKLLIGGNYSMYPRTDASYNKNGTDQTSAFTSTSFNFMLGLHGCIRYFLTRKLSLKANISFLSSAASFNELLRTDYQNGKEIAQYSTKPFALANLTSINISLGVAYSIGK